MTGNSTFGSSLSTGITIQAGSSPEPLRIPKALIATRAVELKDGWVGQVIVTDEIIHETIPFDTARNAEEAATGYVFERLRALLAADPLKPTTNPTNDEN